MKQFKPMLSATHETGGQLTFPVIVSPKLDGIRCVIREGQALSRSLKPIANKALRELLSHPLLEGLDGELISGSETDETAFNSTTRSVMSHEGETGQIRFHVFDDFTSPLLPFRQRLQIATERVSSLRDEFPLTIVQHWLVNSLEELNSTYEMFLERGYEGLMIRDPNGLYKYGRSTAKEGGLLKMKPWVDSEAEILGFDELERNHNEAKLDELGHTKRSTSKEGKVAGGTLGALHVRDIHSGQEFSIGGGYTAAKRDELWSEKDSLVGRIVKYKSVIIGVKDAPRFPVFIGFRDIRDLEAA
jgi:DNA ligase-1